MKSLSRILSAAGLVLGLALAAVPAGAQQPAPQPPAAPLKPASPAAIAAAKELLALKGVGGIYAAAVPNLVQRAKDQLVGSNLNYQKDLNAFYKTPVGQKLLAQEPKSVQASMTYMQQWAQSFSDTVMGEFRSEMKKRGKPIS